MPLRRTTRRQRDPDPARGSDTSIAHARHPLSRIDASSSATSVAAGVVMFASTRVRPSSISTVPINPQRAGTFARIWRTRYVVVVFAVGPGDR